MNKGTKIGLIIGGIALAGAGAFIFIKKKKKKSILSSSESEKIEEVAKDIASSGSSTSSSSSSSSSPAFNPKDDAEKIYDLLAWYTSTQDEKLIMQILNKRSKSQRKSIENYFDSKYSKGFAQAPLKDWLEDDLSTDRWNEAKTLMGY